MSFLSDYLFFNSGNEAPENFHLWSALAVASAVVNRKVYIDWPPHRIYTNLYVLLVGDQGSRKGVAEGLAKDTVKLNFPNIPIGASVTSPQAITKKMASIECTHSFVDELGVSTEVHPIAFFVSELKHFLGLNQMGMIDLLTDAYDDKYIEADYKTAGNDIIINPYITLLACETPDWILTRLKNEMISGGFARRIIPIYEKSIREPIPIPFQTPEMMKAQFRCISTLQKISQKIGQVKFTPKAKDIYAKWYTDELRKPPIEPLMRGFASSKHTQMLKVATLLTLLDTDDLLLTEETILISIQLIQNTLPGMEELYKGAGRNELARPTERLMEWLNSRGGVVAEKEFLLVANRDMDPRESYSVLMHLKNTEQIVILEQTLPNGNKKRLIATPVKATELASKKPSAPPT